VTALHSHLSSVEYVQTVVQQEMQDLPNINISTPFHISSHHTICFSASPATNVCHYNTIASIALYSGNYKINDRQEYANTSVQVDVALNSNRLIVTDNEDTTDYYTSSGTLSYNDADFLDLPVKVSDHQTLLISLSRPNVSAGQMGVQKVQTFLYYL
jgi:hypothetical protein